MPHGLAVLVAVSSLQFHCQHELLTLYVPVFNPETDRLELEDQAKYYSYLAKSGLTGLVILGTNAETLLLTVSTQTQNQI